MPEEGFRWEEIPRPPVTTCRRERPTRGFWRGSSVRGAMSTAQRRPGRAGDAAEAPVRVRSRSESLQWAFSNWCRIISVVILFVGFLVAVIYASAKLRFVEDVIPRISGAFSQPWRTS